MVGCLALGAGVWAQQPPAGAVTEPKPAPAAAPAQPLAPKPVITCKDKRLTARAKDAQLESLLEQVALACGVPVILDGEVGDERVSVDINDFPVDEALRQILSRYDAFYLYEAADLPDSGEPKPGADPATAAPRLRSVWVYARGQGIGLEPVPPEEWASTREFENRLGDPDPAVRFRALQVLVERLGDGARDAVLQLLNDTDERVRAEVLLAAVEEGVELPADLLTNLFYNDASAQVRFLALEGLRDDANAREFAERALKDPDQHVQNLAREILAGLDEAARPRPTISGQPAPGPPTPGSGTPPK